MATSEPLLTANDRTEAVPPRRSETIANELDLELAMGKMNRYELMKFLMNPNNWPITILIVISLIVLVRILGYEITHPMKAGFVMQTLLVCFGGLVFATYYTYISKQLQELVDRFRALNKQLESQVGRLEDANGKLQQTSDDLQEELLAFQKLKGQLQEFASEQKADFKEVFKQAFGIFDEIKKTHRMQRVALLKNMAMNLEFLDQEEGITSKEWQRYVSRAPEEFKPKLKEIIFQDVANSDGLVDFGTMDGIIERIVSAPSLDSFSTSFSSA